MEGYRIRPFLHRYIPRNQEALSSKLQFGKPKIDVHALRRTIVSAPAMPLPYVDFYDLLVGGKNRHVKHGNVSLARTSL